MNNTTTTTNNKIIIVKSDIGNGLVANEDINKDELIFIDKPWVWTYQHDYNINRIYCYTCGILLLEDINNNNNNNNNKEIIKCCLECPEIFCSINCKNKSYENGYEWLCSSNILDKTILSDIYNMDKKGHIILALKIYCEIAEKYINNNDISSSTYLDPLIISNNILDGYMTADYCQTQHAVRTGLTIFDTSLFNDLIAPAYFDSNLSIPFNKIKCIFDNNKKWDNYQEHKLNFMKSNIFLDQLFFRSIIGMFVINNLQLDNGLNLIGSGLYPIYSKMNHSCLYNIRNDINNDKEVYVYAARDIKKGEDILTTYLHEDPSTLTKSERKRQLKQYLFECNCTMCNEQESDDDDDNDDDNE